MSKQITKTQVLKFLRSVSIMVLAATNDDRPLSTVLLFAVDDDFNFYFATKSETYKAKAITKNPKVSFSVWQHKQMLVQIDGEAKPLENEEAINKAVEDIAHATENIKDFWPPILRVRGKGDYVVFKIKPSWIRAMDISIDTIKESETSFTEIEI
ncbi:MAG: pyridoxamine 5'-phosphate oxidase family protein [Candidatus Pacebacteria bacterium]|nr:pyridoxamine 5'-phosphate oxidase family protein [Candidatus Paceibacterota bacterium]